MRRICCILIPLALGSCKSKNPGKEQHPVALYTPDFNTGGPPALVYKTKADYNNLVPVILSDDKSTIVSYPDPRDVTADNNFLMPTLLKKGYLLDNRGIGSNVAFINMTYEAYSKLEKAPALNELYNMITDKDPLVELCNCGNKFKLTAPVDQLNTLIDSNKIRTVCVPVK